MVYYSIMLIVAAVLTFFIGLVHSVLGEHFILQRLFRMESLPALFGDDWFTRQTLRFAWHLTTLAWWGAAIIMLLIYANADNLQQSVLLTICGVFAISGIIAAIFSKLKHLSWIVFCSIAALCGYVGLFSLN